MHIVCLIVFHMLNPVCSVITELRIYLKTVLYEALGVAYVSTDARSNELVNIQPVCEHRKSFWIIQTSHAWTKAQRSTFLCETMILP